MNFNFKWETVYCKSDTLEMTCRAKVLGGWIVRHVTRTQNGRESCMVFIKDITHEWTI